MDNHNQKNGNTGRNIWGLFVGLLVGGLAGAGAMLLLAPQSGKKTRAQIQQRGVELRDQTVKTLEGAVAQVRGKARQITDGVREQAGELLQRGQNMLDEQGNQASSTPKGQGKAVQA